MLLTRSFSHRDGQAADEAEAWAIFHERALRELRYRTQHVLPALIERTVMELVPARDAGDVCHVCGELVTWVDHLPPLVLEDGVRCFANVRSLHVHPGLSTDVVIDDIFPRV